MINEALQYYNWMKLGIQIDIRDIPFYVIQICETIEEEIANDMQDKITEAKIKSRL